MKQLKLFNAIKSEFDEQIALYVCQAVAIYSTTKVKTNLEKHHARATNKVKRFLINLTPDDMQLVLDLLDCVYSWDVRCSLDGIGGCKAKTFKELLDIKRNGSNNG